MKSWIVGTLGVGILMACTSSALAGWGHGGRPAPHYRHHANWRGYPGPRCDYRYGCAPRPIGVPYGYGVGFAPGYAPYPAGGFGLATRNFSFWLQQ